MIIDYMIWIIPYALACYGIAMWGGTKEFGFFKTLLVSFFLTPIVGVIVVMNSKKREPVKTTWEREQISEEYPLEVRIEYSRLLSDFHDGEISEDEFERRKKELLS
jgi:hypothetical protein